MPWKPKLIRGGKTDPAADQAPRPDLAPPAGEVSDADLVHRTLQGLPAEGPSRLPGHDAFAALVERHQTQVLRLARHLLRDADAAQDVGQDTFLRAFRSLASFRPDLSFRSWLLKITVNAARDHVSRRASWRLRPIEMASEIAAPDDVAAAAEAAILLDQVRGLVSQLHPREREVFVLRDLEGLETDEVAEILGLEAPTVRRHLARARLRLRELMGPADDAGPPDSFPPR